MCVYYIYFCMFYIETDIRKFCFLSHFRPVLLLKDKIYVTKKMLEHKCYHRASTMMSLEIMSHPRVVSYALIVRVRDFIHLDRLIKRPFVVGIFWIYRALSFKLFPTLLLTDSASRR